MISILIPTYNYDIVSLVKRVHKQALECGIDFEIRVYDDGSKSIINKKNQNISNLEYCVFKELPNNIGRSAIRNLLAKDAKNNWLLFLDADVMPSNSNFLKTYLTAIKENSKIIYGGIKYQKEQPDKANLLRWIYGKKREALSVTNRNKNKYLRFLTLNFLIHKDVFNSVSFNEEIPNSRHEDTLFAIQLKQKKINLKHINNTCLHLGLDTSSQFLEKSLESIVLLNDLIKLNLIGTKNLQLTKAHNFIKKIGLQNLFRYIYIKYKIVFEKQLLSKRPSLFLFDIYRLSYFCHINTNK